MFTFNESLPTTQNNKHTHMIWYNRMKWKSIAIWVVMFVVFPLYVNASIKKNIKKKYNWKKFFEMWKIVPDIFFFNFISFNDSESSLINFKTKQQKSLHFQWKFSCSNLIYKYKLLLNIKNKNNKEVKKERVERQHIKRRLRDRSSFCIYTFPHSINPFDLTFICMPE